MNVTETAIALGLLRGWNQTHFESLCGYHKGRFTRWKNGEGNPGPDDITRMARTLGISESRLTGLPPLPSAGAWGDFDALIDAHGVDACVAWIKDGIARAAERPPAQAGGPNVVDFSPPRGRRKKSS